MVGACGGRVWSARACRKTTPAPPRLLNRAPGDDRPPELHLSTAFNVSKHFGVMALGLERWPAAYPPVTATGGGLSIDGKRTRRTVPRGYWDPNRVLRRERDAANNQVLTQCDDHPGHQNPSFPLPFYPLPLPLPLPAHLMSTVIRVRA